MANPVKSLTSGIDFRPGIIIKKVLLQNSLKQKGWIEIGPVSKSNIYEKPKRIVQ